MTTRAEDALIALRQIQRKTELAAKRLAQTAGLTPSQLVVLQLLKERGETSAGELSQLTQLKHATITSLVDKLVTRGYVTRRKSDADKRKVWLTLTDNGLTGLTAAPDLLQEVFEKRFDGLPDWHQSMLVSALERVSALLDAEDLDAAPVLDVGALDEKPNH
ncbi:MAG: MarR family transcriptional regulator [Pseudomonadota bacterium]